jgi:hypothetical protein
MNNLINYITNGFLTSNCAIDIYVIKNFYSNGHCFADINDKVNLLAYLLYIYFEKKHTLFPGYNFLYKFRIENTYKTKQT